MVSGLTLLACACCSHLCIWYPQPLQFIPSGPTHQGPEQRHSDGQLYMEQDSCSPGHKPHCPSSSSDSLWSCPAWLLILGKHHCVASSREAQAEAELGMGTSFPDFLMAQDSRAPAQVYFPEIVMRSKLHNEKIFGGQLFLYPKPATAKGGRQDAAPTPCTWKKKRAKHHIENGPNIHPVDVLIQKDTCTPVFTAALFTVAKTWKQPKCPSTDDWMKKM